MIKRVFNIARFAGLGLVVLIGGGFAGYAYLQTQGSVVIFDNPTAQAVSVAVDGETHELAGGQSLVLELDEGDHEVAASAGGNELTRERVHVGAGPYRGLFDVSGQGNYVVVRATYDAAGGGTNVQILPEGHFRALPADASRDGMNQPFPDSVTTQGGATTLVHVCRFDPESESIGCPGA